jgi:uncharacterized membrane protein
MLDNVAARVVHVMILSMLPFAELRVAIPYGITKGLHPVVAFTAAVVATWVVIVPMFLVLDLFYERFFSRFAVVRHFVEKVRAGGRSYVERWGVVGVGIYVSLPLPGPGIYSGAVLAWLFRLPRRHAIAALAVGSLVSAMLVAGISTPIIALIRKILHVPGY